MATLLTLRRPCYQLTPFIPLQTTRRPVIRESPSPPSSFRVLTTTRPSPSPRRRFHPLLHHRPCQRVTPTILASISLPFLFTLPPLFSHVTIPSQPVRRQPSSQPPFLPLRRRRLRRRRLRLLPRCRRHLRRRQLAREYFLVPKLTCIVVRRETL